MKDLVGVDQAVNRLLARIVDESLREKAENVLRKIVRELMKTPGAIDELEKAIEDPTTPSPNCILIPKSMSQFSPKNRPNDIWLMAQFCCALWRWPGIKWSNLHTVPVCEYPALSLFHGLNRVNRQPVCINPSHFRYYDPAEGLERLCRDAYDEIFKRPIHLRGRTPSR